MYYIAYGSNMAKVEMSKRCPNAIFIKKDKLLDYKIEFKSMDTVNSYATIKKSKGDFVDVIIWKITKEEELILDDYEAINKKLYYKKNMNVLVDNKKSKALIYIMNKKALPKRPTDQYLKSIENGYLEYDFDYNKITKII